MAVGASNVQFCTAVMHYGFDIIDDLRGGLSYFMEQKGVKSVSEIVGKSLKYITTHDNLVQKSKVVSHIDDDKCIGCGDCYTACQDGGHMAIIFNRETRVASVDEEKCVGCGFCQGVCPVENCITIKNIL